MSISMRADRLRRLPSVRRSTRPPQGVWSRPAAGAVVPWSPACTTATDCTFHQIAPYIGRIKTTIANYLIREYSRPGQWVLDPFCGSGVVPLEASLLGRAVIASDINPYGITLTRAKLLAPADEQAALDRLRIRWRVAQARLTDQDLRAVPKWVRRFFHPETLRSALALRDELVARSDWFLLGCLLGILHHQRPGFLSYPSSHLVPYLRDKLFARKSYPEMYEPRDVFSRMEAKVRRTYRRPPVSRFPVRILQADSRLLRLPRQVDAVVTSPPYMNELDYVRDNRLRLWFLNRELPAHKDIQRGKREEMFRELIEKTFSRIAPRLPKNGVIALVVGEASRGGVVLDSSSIIRRVFEESCRLDAFRLEREIHDTIPDIRRSRRDLRGTKRETVLVFRKSRRT